MIFPKIIINKRNDTIMFEYAAELFKKNTKKISDEPQVLAINKKINLLADTHDHDAKKLCNLLAEICNQQDLCRRSSARTLHQLMESIIRNYYEKYEKLVPRDPIRFRNRLKEKLKLFYKQLENNVFIFTPPEVPQKTVAKETPMKDPRRYDRQFDLDGVRGLHVIPRIKKPGGKPTKPTEQLEELTLDDKLAYLIKKFTTQNNDVEYINTFKQFMTTVMTSLRLTPQSPQHHALIEPLTRTHARITFTGTILTLLPLRQFIEGPLERPDNQPWFSFSQIMDIKQSDDQQNWEFIRGPFLVIPCACQMLIPGDSVFTTPFDQLPHVKRYREDILPPAIVHSDTFIAEEMKKMLAEQSTPADQDDSAAGAGSDPRLFHRRASGQDGSAAGAGGDPALFHRPTPDYQGRSAAGARRKLNLGP